MEFIGGTLLESGNLVKIEVACSFTFGAYQESSAADFVANSEQTRYCVRHSRTSVYWSKPNDPADVLAGSQVVVALLHLVK